MSTYSGNKRYLSPAHCHLASPRPAYEASPDRRIRMPKDALAVVGHIGPASAGGQMSAPHALAALGGARPADPAADFRLLMREGRAGSPPVRSPRRSAVRTTRSRPIWPFSPGRASSRRTGRTLDHLPRRRRNHAPPDRLPGHRLLDGHPELCALSTAAVRAGRARLLTRTEARKTQPISDWLRAVRPCGPARRARARHLPCGRGPSRNPLL